VDKRSALKRLAVIEKEAEELRKIIEIGQDRVHPRSVRCGERTRVCY